MNTRATRRSIFTMNGSSCFVAFVVISSIIIDIVSIYLVVSSYYSLLQTCNGHVEFVTRRRGNPTYIFSHSFYHSMLYHDQPDITCTLLLDSGARNRQVRIEIIELDLRGCNSGRLAVTDGRTSGRSVTFGGQCHRRQVTSSGRYLTLKFAAVATANKRTLRQQQQLHKPAAKSKGFRLKITVHKMADNRAELRTRSRALHNAAVAAYNTTTSGFEDQWMMSSLNDYQSHRTTWSRASNAEQTTCNTYSANICLVDSRMQPQAIYINNKNHHHQQHNSNAILRGVKWLIKKLGMRFNRRVLIQFVKRIGVCTLTIAEIVLLCNALRLMQARWWPQWLHIDLEQPNESSLVTIMAILSVLVASTILPLLLETPSTVQQNNVVLYMSVTQGKFQMLLDLASISLITIMRICLFLMFMQYRLYATTQEERSITDKRQGG